MPICKTDIYEQFDIKEHTLIISKAAMYNHKLYSKKAKQNMVWARKALEVISDLFTLPKEGIILRVAPIRGKQCIAQCQVGGKIVTVHPLASKRMWFEALAHELVHAEQYETGTLSGGNVWLGKKIKAAYKDQPWEIEAYGREKDMAQKILEAIGEDLSDNVESFPKEKKGFSEVERPEPVECTFTQRVRPEPVGSMHQPVEV